MKRLVIDNLIEWKNSKYRKPLILEGVRQVGKTWLLKEFGKLCYENVVYFNFDENPEYSEFFNVTKDTVRIINNLSLSIGETIDPNKSLIIFDEIQDFPNIINSLKYFYENSNEYHIVCAGSLLGIKLAKPSSFPVGKVDFLKIYPMTLTESLLASSDDNLIAYMETIDSIETIPDAFFSKLVEKLRIYFLTGGMPEALKVWNETLDIKLTQKTISNIISGYERDFLKHPEISAVPKMSYIWKSIPSQLSKENKKFLYNVIKDGARAREYESALEWLNDARLIYKIYRADAPRLPITAYDDLSAFKIYVNDVGILRTLSGLESNVFSDKNKLFTEFKGSLTENYVLQSLVTQFDVVPRYWSITNPSYEVDFLIQYNNHVIPVEVKYDVNVKSRSLKKYGQLYDDQTILKVRYSLANLKLDDNVLNIPLFMIDYTKKLIDIALKTLSNG